MFSANSSQVSSDRLYVEDVFSTWLYTGNGSTQTITNGIDLAGKGGLVWFKQRSSTESHGLFDTARGVQNRIQSNNTNAEFTTIDGLSAFNSSGFSIGSGNGVNASSQTYASWTFREAPKFFDVVTYTGNGVNGRQIAHNLGVTPGFIIYKCTSTAASWLVLHRSLPNGFSDAINLNTTDAAFSLGASFAPTATTFTMSNGVDWNQNGATYVAYLFAHDTTSDGIIQCGSYTGNGSATGPTVTLGWEPQWIMIKRSNSTGSWVMLDNMRGMAVGGNDARLLADASDAETTSGNDLSPTATGFQLTTTSPETNANGSTYIYIAIRRGPMRTPTSGTSVFSPIASSGSYGTFLTTGFPVDMQILGKRNGYTYNQVVTDRLRGISSDSSNGTINLSTAATLAESGVIVASSLGWNNAGFVAPDNFAGQSSIYWSFRRAPSFFDEVCYTGTGSARTVNHNLGVAPELILVKVRNASSSWHVYNATIGSGNALALNTDLASFSSAASWNNTAPTSTVFTVNTESSVNGSGKTYVAYLFASCPGVSKVGSYTGNGSSQTINCGFAAGARFVMIKRTDSTGDWYVWDTARGIVAGNDPRLSLNSTAAEVTTDDSVDTDSSGFVVNQLSATNINVSSATYIYLAVA